MAIIKIKTKIELSEKSSPVFEPPLKKWDLHPKKP